MDRRQERQMDAVLAAARSLTDLLRSLLGWETTTAASRNRIEVEEALNENTSRCDAPSEEAPAVKYFIKAEVNGREQWFPVTTSDAEQFDDVIQKQMNETEDSDSCFDLMPQTAVEQRASQQYNDGFEMRRWQPAADDLPSWYTSSDDEDSAATADLWAMPDVGNGRKAFGWDAPKQLTSQKPVPLFQFNEPPAFRMDRNIPRFLYPMRIAMPRMLRRAYRQRTRRIVLVTKTALPIADDLTGVAKMFNNGEKAMDSQPLMDGRPLALEGIKKEDEVSPPCSPARTALNSFFDRLGNQIAKARQSDGSTEEAPLASNAIIQPLLATASIDSQMQQHQIITRAVTATTTPSSPPTTDEAASPAETAQSEKKAEKVVSTANGEEVLAFVVLKNFVLSIADVFGKTMSDAADLLLKFAATTEAAIPQVMEMLEALKTQEKEEKREEVVEAPTLVETLSTWWSPPVQKEPEGVMERLALWWSPPPQEEPQGLLERVGMWWCPPPPPKEPEGLYERLLSWWCPPPPRKEAEAPSLCSAIAKYFSSL